MVETIYTYMYKFYFYFVSLVSKANTLKNTQDIFISQYVAEDFFVSIVEDLCSA